MNLTEEDNIILEDISHTEQKSDDQLFLSDSGELPLEARRVLIQLLIGPSIDARRHSKLWTTLTQNEAVIRSRLAELFLDLVIDRDTQVAFTRQADTGDLAVPRLLRRVQLTFIDSVLLLYLRQRLMQADAQGERAVVSTEEIMEYLSLYERSTNTDHAGFIKRIEAAIEKIKKNNVLQKLHSANDRFEISPVLKLVFSADIINTLTRLYQQKLTVSEE